MIIVLDIRLFAESVDHFQRIQLFLIPNDLISETFGGLKLTF